MLSLHRVTQSPCLTLPKRSSSSSSSLTREHKTRIRRDSRIRHLSLRAASSFDDDDEPILPAEFKDTTTATTEASSSSSSSSSSSDDYKRYRLANPITFKRISTEKEQRKYKKTKDGYYDLVITDNIPTLDSLIRDVIPEQLKPFVPTSVLPGEAIFESPLVSFAYERGWRDSFKRSGFPGLEIEAKNALNALVDSENDIVIDCSCGSGLFTREFARSGKFGGVIALDYSQAMIKEAKERSDKDTSLPADSICFVRADVGRLPFENDSIGGISASAAIHCWPDVQAAVSEIYRVLKNGRVFTGTTFATPNVPFLDDNQNRILSALSRDLSNQNSGSLRFWNPSDLRDQLQSVGFTDVIIEREDNYLFFKARKQQAST